MEGRIPNSHEKPPKRAEKVVTKEVTVKKESFGKKIFDIFIAEDWTAVKDYVIYEKFLPYLKDSLRDSLISGVDMIFGGGGQVRPRSSSTNSKTSYQSYYDKNSKTPSKKPSGFQGRHGVDELIFEDRYEAEMVLKKMIEILEQYDHVTVADYYEFADVPSDYTDYDWGWKSLETAQTVRLTSGEYTIKLPRVIHID